MRVRYRHGRDIVIRERVSGSKATCGYHHHRVDPCGIELINEVKQRSDEIVPTSPQEACFLSKLPPNYYRKFQTLEEVENTD